MPKHHEKKPHKEGVGVELIGKPDELISLLIKDPKEKTRALDQVINEGPDHKQVYSALLLKRAFKLVKSIEKGTGIPFEAQKGNIIIAHRPEHEESIPIALPLSNGYHAREEEIIKALSHSPGHELVAFGALLQAIEWGIKAMTGAMIVVVLLVCSTVNAQAPPPGPGARPPGPGAALQPVSAFQGRVTGLSANDDYIYDGFYLQTAQDSMLVKFPGHLGTQITSLVKAGSMVTVNGTLEYPPFGGKEIRMLSLTANGQTVYDTPPTPPTAPAAPPAAPADNFVNGNGKVVGTELDREGRMNGLLLDNKTVLRIPPGIAAQLAGLAKNGAQVGYSGMQKMPQTGEVAAGDTKIVHCNTISINGQQFLVR
jgi:hypothetical protein